MPNSSKPQTASFGRLVGGQIDANPFVMPHQLLGLMQGEAPIHVFDVRRAEAFAADRVCVAGGQRLEPWSLPAGLTALRMRLGGSVSMERHRVVMVCVYGHAVSQSACVIARCHRFDAAYLQGGLEEWKRLGLPVVDHLEKTLLCGAMI